MEMKQLEAIWADSSTQWNFDFEHRNEIQESINNAINAQSDQVNIHLLNQAWMTHWIADQLGCGFMGETPV